MWRDPNPKQGWAEWLIGWIFTLLLLAFACSGEETGTDSATSTTDSTTDSGT